jgi:hypothetical protein
MRFAFLEMDGLPQRMVFKEVTLAYLRVMDRGEETNKNRHT